jgi:hypothetical protein
LNVEFARRVSEEDGAEVAVMEIYGVRGLVEQFVGAGDWARRVA